MGNNIECISCGSSRILLASAFSRNRMNTCCDCGHKQKEDVCILDRDDQTALKDNQRG
jgi:hypothetical protein